MDRNNFWTKKVLLSFTVLYLAVASTFAQDNEAIKFVEPTTEELCIMAKQTVATVSPERLNVLYADIPNPVVVAAPVSPEKLRISWDGATANSLGGGRYDVNVPYSMVGKEITITIGADMGNNRVIRLGSTTFRIKSVPEPTVFVGANILGGEQTKEMLLKEPLIAARMPYDFNYEMQWNVVSYTVVFVENGEESPPIRVKGPMFPDEVISRIQSAPSGTNVEFVNITINSIAGTRMMVSPILVRIK